MRGEKEPVQPHRPFLATRSIIPKEADWLNWKERGKGGTPSPCAGGGDHPHPLEDILLRCGLILPSLVEAWAARARAKPRAAGGADVEGDLPDEFWICSDESDWE